jgi:hypothetical protein
MAVSKLNPVSGGVIRKQTTFTSSGTFTLPAGYGAGQPLLVDIEICGGGGKLSGKRWVSTLCPPCAEKRDNRINETQNVSNNEIVVK